MLFLCPFDNLKRHAISYSMYKSIYYPREQELRIQFYNGEVYFFDEVRHSEVAAIESECLHNFQQALLLKSGLTVKPLVKQNS